MLSVRYFLTKPQSYALDPVAPLGISFTLPGCNTVTSGLSCDNRVEEEISWLRSHSLTHPLIGAVSSAPPVIGNSPPTMAPVDLPQQQTRSAMRGSVDGDIANARSSQFEVSDPDEDHAHDMIDEEYPESIIAGEGYLDEVPGGVTLDSPTR